MVFIGTSRPSPADPAPTSANFLSSAFAKLCFGAAAALAGAEPADAQLVSNVVRSGPAAPASSVRLSDPVPASLIKSLAAKVTPATVALTMSLERGPGFGSGTLVDVGPEQFPVLMKNEVLIVTAAHLFSDADRSLPITVTIYDKYDAALKPGSEREMPARLIGLIPGPGKDVALVALQVPEQERLGLLARAASLPERGSSESFSFGDIAVSVGCPGSRTLKVNDKDVLKSSLPTYRDARVLESVVTSEGDSSPGRQIVSIAGVQQGDSGGGLFNQAGKLIGICSSAEAFRKPGEITFYVPGEERIIIPRPGTDRSALEKGTVIAHSEEDRLRHVKALCPDWAEYAPGMGYFTDSQYVYELMDVVTAEFQGLQQDLERVDAHYSEWLKDSEGSFILPVREANHIARIKRAWEYERTVIEQKLRGLKPDYE
jgi:S1-C subfamily serine protease